MIMFKEAESLLACVYFIVNVYIVASGKEVKCFFFFQVKGIFQEQLHRFHCSSKIISFTHYVKTKASSRVGNGLIKQFNMKMK